MVFQTSMYDGEKKHGHVNYEAREAELLYYVPGLNLLTVFCNMYLTNKDGIVLSVGAASKFKYFCSRVVVLHIAQHVKYHIILGNLMEYGYQGHDPGLKV